MAATTIQLLDLVALNRDMPERGLLRGQMGTIVEMLGDDAFEVEFSDSTGKAYAFAALRADDIMLLHGEPARSTG